MCVPVAEHTHHVDTVKIPNVTIAKEVTFNVTLVPLEMSVQKTLMQDRLCIEV